MKIPFQKIANLIAWAYRTFAKGKTIKVGGTDVTLPSQGHGPAPAGQSPFDSVPHKPGPVDGIIPRR